MFSLVFQTNKQIVIHPEQLHSIRVDFGLLVLLRALTCVKQNIKYYQLLEYILKSVYRNFNQSAESKAVNALGIQTSSGQR